MPGQAFKDQTTTAIQTKKVAVSTLVGIAAFGFTAAELADAQRAVISSVTQAVMLTWTAVAPTALIGHQCPANQTIIVQGNTNINALQFIQFTTAADVTITLEK